jgi:ligand-binding SRPBCC domain-containing protein
MKMHRLDERLWLPIDLPAAWAFFSAPENLNRITPEDMNFQILTGGGTRSFAGQIITYNIAPIPGIPLSWVTEITQCVEESYFIDEQRFGPYRFWHHLHRFEAGDGGVWMTDTLHYALPGGALGELFAGPWVHKKVRGIFSYRTLALAAIFPGASVTGPGPR